jgi:hypothetical protein
MRQITLTYREFLNFKKIFKGKFNSTTFHNNEIVIQANSKQLKQLGY